MPRIKAYRGNGAVIPVDEAKIHTAFRCPWTKKVFVNKRDYVAHLAKVRENRMRARIRHARFMTLKQHLHDQQHFKDIIQWLQLHPEFLWQHSPNRSVPMPQDFWLKITFLDVIWRDLASNSHSAPQGGVTNWHKYPDKPLGYPGWVGRIEVQVSHGCDISNMLDAVGIRTGSGGASKNCYGYEVTFFEADWPGLEKMRAWMILQDHTPVAFTEGRSSRYY
jgi:uncharacterized C2H2 Zn-finger protein